MSRKCCARSVQDVENYLPSAVVLGSGDYEQGEEVFNALGTDSYGYDEGKVCSDTGKWGTERSTVVQRHAEAT